MSKIYSKISGIGYYVPDNIVTNDELSTMMDTSDEWITKRTGIKERRYVRRGKENNTSLATQASLNAIASANIDKSHIDFIIYATLSPDYFFPGNGVLLQRSLGISNTEIGALDVRTQCTGFVYALSIADQFIRSGTYKTILVVGSEVHSTGLDFSDRGRGVSVIFGDGAGAAIVEASTEPGIYGSYLHSDGTQAESLAMINPGSDTGIFQDPEPFGFPSEEEQKYGGLFITKKIFDDGLYFPFMDGQAVFKKAVEKFPEVILESLEKNGYKLSDLNMLIPHQANIRIIQMVQHLLKLREDQVFVNLHKYGNTTAASIPIALAEAYKEGKIKKGDLVCLGSFGSGFTWASTLLRWMID